MAGFAQTPELGLSGGFETTSNSWMETMKIRVCGLV